MNKCFLLLALSTVLLSSIVNASPLKALGHIHNLAFVGEKQQTLLLGTHHGVFSYEQETPQLVSSVSFDVMGMAYDPSNGALYASGHPQQGGNTGLLRSADTGKSFEQVSEGVNGPVDFHQLTISPADPKVIYGVHGKLQVSRDGGKNWSVQGQLPQKLLKLAASAVNPDRLYAASEAGLYVSDDAGSNWQSLFPYPATAVLVHDGYVYAFVVGKGLIKSAEGMQQWQEVNNAFGSQVLLDMALSGDGQRIVGLNQYGALVESRDQGSNWQSLPAKPQPATAEEKKGQQLFQRHCQSCHGLKAVGETYSIEGLTTQGYLFAPALNGSMHAWHHTDEQLLKTIQEGSPRTQKMPAWKGTLSEADSMAVISYLKTLWGETQKRCQGPGHMDQECLQGQ